MKKVVLSLMVGSLFIVGCGNTQNSSMSNQTAFAKWHKSSTASNKKNKKDFAKWINESDSRRRMQI